MTFGMNPGRVDCHPSLCHRELPKMEPPRGGMNTALLQGHTVLQGLCVNTVVRFLDLKVGGSWTQGACHLSAE